MQETEGARTVLVVDDAPHDVRLVVETLSREGFRVLVAESGESALEQLRHVQPDAILLDYRLPGIDGIEVCRRIAATPELVDVPVLFCTSVHEVEEKVRALAAGAVDYVTKPLASPEVLARVRTHVRISTLKRALAERNAALEAEVAMRVEAEGLLRDSLDRALIVAAPDGRLHFATRGAAALLARRFPGEASDRLPSELQPGGTPPAGLTVRRFAPPAESDLAVLELADTAAGPAALLALGLTPREAEVLFWIAEGKTNAEIATILASARRTVEKHVEHLLGKLGVENRAAATRVAVEALR
jgi:DNA-binding response OmpR family regulator/DNA-binding CsgD family transcriptional regulator